jgi:predicted O-methyltransferase YrrM
MVDFATYLKASGKVAGWTRGDEARALMKAAFEAPEGAQIVEIGSFLGGGSIFLAGARKLAGSGRLYCMTLSTVRATRPRSRVIMRYGSPSVLDRFERSSTKTSQTPVFRS